MGKLLVKKCQRHLPGADDGHQFFQVGHLPRVGRLVPQHPHMMGQAAPVLVVRPLTQQVEHLRESQRHKKIVGAVRVADEEERRRFPISQLVQLQLVVGHDLPELWDVKGGQTSAAGDQNALGRLAAGQLVLFVLLDRKAIRLALFQALEHIVHRVHVVLVVLLHLHAGDHVHQSIHIPVLRRALEDDIGDEGAVEQGLGFRPERIALLALALGVGNEGVDELQNVRLVADVGQGVIVHGLGEVDGIEYLDFIALPLEKGPHLGERASLGVYHHIGRMSLEQLGGQPEPGLAGAGRAHHTGVEVAGVGGIFGPGVHGEQLRPGENDVVLELGVGERLYILRRAPPGAAVLFIPAILLRFFGLGVHHQPERRSPGDAHQPVKGVEPRGEVGKGRADGLPHADELMGEVCAGGQPVGGAEFQKGPQDEQVGQVWQKNLFDITDLHAPPPSPVPAHGGAAAAPAPVLF